MARININVPEEVLDEISEVVEPRKRSRFITEAILRSLNELRGKKLALEYEEAAEEIRKVNRDLEGAIADGLD
jgi:metal-responsive CopG/Arc/MetJ family transcriptional regulator